jgi:hypothetical protein
MKVSRLLSTIVLVTFVFAPRLFAQSNAKETKIMIRAVARDAKVIGQHVGGARITVRDVSTGQVLAQGVQQAGTGDTDLIMNKPRTRGATVYNTSDASGFLAVLNLERPTVVEVTAEGPLGNAQATQRTSKTLLLVPGEDVLGEGILLEIHGFIVTPLAPLADAKVAVGSPLEVRATVTMACGCPIEPGGIWDANKYRVVARVVRGGHVEAEVPLHYAGQQNTFAGTVPISTAGKVELDILALDPPSANFGMFHQDVTVTP